MLGEPPAPFPIDMMASTTVGVQRISKDCYRQHRDATRVAIRRLVDDLVASDAWRDALRRPDPAQATRALVRERFAYEPKGHVEPDDWPELLKSEAVANHDAHLGRVAGFYAEQIGLAVVRRGAGRWYGASDGFLEALVLANVRGPVELETFLDRLWQRYRIVIGPTVGREAFETVSHGHLKANQLLLEERLRVLGLAQRLSDDCAFVRNPFFEETR